jgi:hypothetical protein
MATDRDRRLAMQIADMFLLEPPEQVAWILAEALRLAMERYMARRKRQEAGGTFAAEETEARR